MDCVSPTASRSAVICHSTHSVMLNNMERRRSRLVWVLLLHSDSCSTLSDPSSRRKPRLSPNFTQAQSAHRHTGNGKRFHRHGHMTRAGRVDGSGEKGWWWGLGGEAGMVRVRRTACLFFNETYRSQFVYFIFLLRASAPNAVCGFSFPCKMCPAF